MSYEMYITFENEYLRVRVTAQDNYETSLKFFKELAKACEAYKCRNILAISDSTPLETMEAYDHAEILREAGFTIKHRIAWVEKNAKAREMDKFIETVLVNRAVIQVKIFSDESEAKQWLLEDQTA